MLAMESTIGNPVASLELQEWCLSLCGLCTMVPPAREPVMVPNARVTTSPKVVGKQGSFGQASSVVCQFLGQIVKS